MTLCTPFNEPCCGCFDVLVSETLQLQGCEGGTSTPRAEGDQGLRRIRHDRLDIGCQLSSWNVFGSWYMTAHPFVGFPHVDNKGWQSRL